MKELSKILMRFISLILGIEQFESFPPPLNKTEEAEAFAKMRNGDKKARELIIERNLRLVSHIIRKYYSTYQNTDELLSVGSFGLIKAVDSFKSEYGTRFATYGAKCVQNEILMYFRSQKKQQNEVSINDTIDMDKDGNPLTYLDVISTEENIADKIDLKIHTTKLLRLVDEILDKRELEIVTLRYGLRGYKPLTQREVAAHLKISRSYVSRIEKHALEKLRDAFGNTRPEFED
ncbi:MAG: RNA polymerase sporulation sigma factor SigK [Clostridia bacterium]|nr:RNA polymerase sporulation sigma factor SigK [Clostridia bacterium]